MAIVRDITPDQFSKLKLTDVNLVAGTSTDASARYVASDNTTVYGVLGNAIVSTVNNGTSWQTVTDIGEPVNGLWPLPNGELLASSYIAGGKGGLFISNGWATNPSTSTFTKVVTYSNNANRATDAWNVSVAPKGHVREGLIVANEYGGQSTVSTPDSDGAVRSWVSTDYGQTWRVFANLFQITGNKANLHNHGIAYDPYDDRVLISFGDGNGTGALSGVIYSDDFLEATPTWKYMVGPYTDATFQATTIFPMDNCILFGGDGMPCGIYRVVRTGFRALGKIRCVVGYGSGTDTGFIGQTMYQREPGQPVLIANQWGKTTGTNQYSLHTTTDGVTFEELYRGAIGTGLSWLTAVGPTKDGTVLLRTRLNGTDYQKGTAKITLI